MNDAAHRPVPTRKRRWLRYSLSGAAVMGLLLACWIGYQWNWIRQRHHAKVGFGVGQVALVQPDGTHKMATTTVAPPWPLGWFGEQGRQFLMLPDFTAQDEIDRIRALFPEGKLDLLPLTEDEARQWATADARSVHPD